MGNGVTINTNNQRTLKSLSQHEVAQIVTLLGDKYIPYSKMFIDNCIDGEYLYLLDNDQELLELLISLGINNKIHQKSLIVQLNKLKSGVLLKEFKEKERINIEKTVENEKLEKKLKQKNQEDNQKRIDQEILETKRKENQLSLEKELIELKNTSPAKYASRMSNISSDKAYKLPLDKKNKKKYDNIGIYIGELKNYKHDGYGIFRWDNGSTYEGQFVDGHMEGYGIFRYAYGCIYEGECHNSLFHGYGIMKWSSGNIYIGQFKMQHYDGYGVMYWNNGDIYKGMWENGYQDGIGSYIKKSNNEINKGKWKQDKFIGES